MIDFPGSKINLGLRVTQRLDNGYHTIESIFIPSDFSDVLEIIKLDEKESSRFYFKGLSIPGDPKDNLIYKAYKLLSRDFEIPPFEAHLLKIIPTGTGLGGGSADASSMLILFNRLFELEISTRDLEIYAKMLGADCPFFIKKLCAYVEGIGDKISPFELDLSSYHLLILCPDLHISTKEAFQNIIPTHPDQHLKDIILNYPIEKWKDYVFNDFEDYAFHTHPELEDIKAGIYDMGALYASMSGSGSAIYGIFSSQIDLAPSLSEYVHFWQKL